MAKPAKQEVKKAAPVKEVPVKTEEKAEKGQLTYDDIIKAAAAKSGLSQKDVHTILRATEESIAEGIASGKKVQLTGFVTFKLTYRSARKANNVFTGKEMDVPASVGVSVSTGKRLKDAASTLNPKDFEK